MLRYFVIYKPYQVLSQFSSVKGKRTLKDIYSLPKDVYSIGRLDYDSEGLLIVTNDRQLNHRLLNPQFNHEREYWVEVEGLISESNIRQLEAGVNVTIDGNRYKTKPCRVSVFIDTPAVGERMPPVRYRKNIPTSWIKLVLTEGKNRQVRKMTAAVGFPTLRLIRVRIEGLVLHPLQPGEIKELSQVEIYSKLFENKSS